jgi:hypothetical protein
MDSHGGFRCAVLLAMNLTHVHTYMDIYILTLISTHKLVHISDMHTYVCIYIYIYIYIYYTAPRTHAHGVYAHAGKFEDDCRMLLGTNSYELYTLDKVVEKLLGQAQSLTSDASSQSGAKLLALHEYEHLRSVSNVYMPICFLLFDKLLALHEYEHLIHTYCRYILNIFVA